MTIYELKNNLNLTYKEIANLTGLKINTIYKICNNYSPLKQSTIDYYKKVFYDAFKIDIEFTSNEAITDLKYKILELQKENKALKKKIVNIINHLTALKNLLNDLENIEKPSKYKRNYLRARYKNKKFIEYNE